MGTAQSLSLATPLDSFPGIGPALSKKLAKLNLATAGDLLWHLPRRWDDFSRPQKISTVKIGEAATIAGRVLEVVTERSPRKRLWITTALVKDDSGAIKLIWFNQPYLDRLFTPQSTWIFTGKANLGPHGLTLESPLYERRAGLYSVYNETSGVSSRMLRRHLQAVLPLVVQVDDFLPENLRRQEKLIDLRSALRRIHFPETARDIEQAKERIAFDELFLLSLRVQLIRRELAAAKAPYLSIDEKLLRRFAESLSFKLTAAQRRAAWEIVQDLSRDIPMNRLLEGDVGSGKTVTALFGVLTAVKNGCQAVWLAPTEILAHQHYATAQHLLEKFDVDVGILTGSRKENGGADLVIGTHALLYDHAHFPRLALLIIDEQHRFGIKQRAALRSKHDLVPHLLSMTATPIPRTLALTVYGDLDLSILDEVPAGRKRIATNIVPPAERAKAYAFIRKEIARGRQAFVITPLIEPKRQTSPEEIERKSAVAEYDKLSREIFPDLKLGLLHGKMPPAEKERVMQDFNKGKIDILVSTAVVEVGIDVPNASVMIIEGAERFGLAQLHQLRGRVGRAEHQSYCLCFAQSWSAMTKERLQAFVRAKNGFELAELDLALRGPGELVGLRQAGLPDLKMASLTDSFLIRKARAAAEKVLADGLEKYPMIAAELKHYVHTRHLE